MKKISIGSLLFVLLINALLLVLAYNSTGGYRLKEIKNKRIADINFDSRSNDPQIKSIKCYSEQTRAQINDASVQFKVKVKNVALVEDVFQTAPMDRGIRLELQNGALNLIINTKSNVPRSITLINAVQPNVEYPIAISIDRNNKLKVMIGSGSGEGINENLRFEISDIAIGTGYSQTRFFDGIISDFSLEYSLYTMVAPGYYSAIRFLLLVSMASLFCLLFYTSNRTPEFLTREIKITLASAIILIGFSSAVFFHYVLGAYLNRPYPYNTFLFSPWDGFNDFFNMLNINKDLNPYFCQYFFHSNYYPFANIIFFLFSFINKWVSLVLFSLIFLIPFLILNKHYFDISPMSNMINLFIYTFLTLPFLSILDRGNIEGWVFLCTALFIYYFQKNKSIIACIFLSMAIAMKLFPVIFLILLFAEKKYKEITITVALALLISLISISLFKNGFFNNIRFVLSGFDTKNSIEFGDNLFLQRGVSLFSIVKLILIKTNIIHSMEMPSVLSMYVKMSLLVFGLIAVYIYFIEKEFWKKVTLLIFSMLLLPHVSAEYKLIYIFIPLYLFINSNKKAKLNLFYLLALALLLIPKDYYYYFQDVVSETGNQDFSINNIMNSAILVTMMAVIMVSGLSNTNRKNEMPILVKMKRKNKG